MNQQKTKKFINAFIQSQHGYGSPGVTTADFFREEYQLNYKLATANESRPQISLWDGIVFGGGVGITIHGRYRIATENSLFAMPETAIVSFILYFLFLFVIFF